MYRVFRIVPFATVVALTALPAIGQSYSSVIYNAHTNQCLQPVDYSEGSPIVQMPCNGAFLQQWTPWWEGNGIIKYQNSWTGMWLDARGGAANGTPVQQWEGSKISNENWQPGQADEDGIPSLKSRVSGTNSYCLDIPGGRTTPGLAMQIYVCNGTVSQEWTITAQIVE